MTDDTGGEQFVQELMNELGATIYVEIIVIRPNIGTTEVGSPTACSRVCDSVNGVTIQRDLFDPATVPDVRSLITRKGANADEYTIYKRNQQTNVLTPISVFAPIYTRMSIVAVKNGISDGKLAYAMRHIATHRAILPSRVLP